MKIKAVLIDDEPLALNVLESLLQSHPNVEIVEPEEVNNYNSDPVKSLFAIKKMKENSKGQTELYQSLANYFKDNGIIFQDSNAIIFWDSFK
jgi:hypothetical protein